MKKIFAFAFLLTSVITHGSCTTKLLNPNKNTGFIHIVGIKAIRVTPANPPAFPFPIVEIAFQQAMWVNTILLVSCPDSPPVTVPSLGLPALPYYIKFAAKDAEQVILEKGTQSGPEKAHYKFTVKPIKE